ncbi:MAG: hypothetical protein QNK03_14875 [Myxococcota bacterium]|nr:hypothetical protein [Myxococcota bacterium]
MHRGTLAARLLASCALVILVATAGPVQAAKPHRGECRKLTRQITHFEGVVEMAQERDNELWELATLKHINRLAYRRAKLCPEFRGPSPREQMAKLLKTAGKLAIQYFTFGAF